MEKHSLTDTQKLITEECEFIAQHLIKKNQAYGNSFADPINIFAESSPIEQINVRIDDKIKRLMNKDREAKQLVPEDTVLDLLGYLILKRVLKRMGY